MDTIYVEVDEFEKARERLEPDATFVSRLHLQLSQCKLNAPTPIVVPSKNSRFTRGTSRSYHDHPSHNSSHNSTNIPNNNYNNNNNNNNNNNRHRGNASRDYASRNFVTKPSSILGLLNKVSPRNIEVILKSVVDMCAAKGVDAKTIETIIEHSFKQPTYINMFLRILGELASLNREVSNKTVTLMINRSIDVHIHEPFVSDALYKVDRGGKTSVTEYDDFCHKTKSVKTLKSKVTFAIGCIRAQLCDLLDMNDYVGVIFENVENSKSVEDLEILLEVVETVFACCDIKVKNLLRSRMNDWAEQRTNGLRDLSTRARFKLQDLLEVSC